LTPPAHEPGSHPKFLNEHGVTVVIAGGMGIRAQELMAENGIKAMSAYAINHFQTSSHNM